MEFNRIDVIILKRLKNSNATNELRSMTRNEINKINAEDKITSRNNLIRRLEFLEENEFISKGVISGNSFSYFITEKGIDKIQPKS